MYVDILLIVWSNFVHISLKLASIFSQGEPVRRHREFAAGGRVPGARELRPSRAQPFSESQVALSASLCRNVNESQSLEYTN